MYPGVPQGSSLGQLMFLILITDIGDCIDFASATSFAADTRILGEISNESNCVYVQNHLIRLYKWATNNNMNSNNENLNSSATVLNAEICINTRSMDSQILFTLQKMVP